MTQQDQTRILNKPLLSLSKLLKASFAWDHWMGPWGRPWGTQGAWQEGADLELWGPREQQVSSRFHGSTQPTENHRMEKPDLRERGTLQGDGRRKEAGSQTLCFIWSQKAMFSYGKCYLGLF